jgi:SAM-dependent methyltransferase
MLPFEPQVADFYQNLRAIAPGRVEQFQSLPAANQYRKLYELTDAHVPPDGSVLDWGCGRGHFSYWLLRRGHRVTAYSLEDAPELFDLLPEEERSRLTFVRGTDAVALPFAEASFAAAFSVGVLEHVREYGGTEEGSLRELHRVLRPGGRLVVYHFPNRFSHIEAYARLLRADSHEHRFTAKEIARLTAATGFAVRDVARYGFLPRNSFNRLPGSLRSSERVASIVNGVDRVLERVFSPLAQNYYFVAER